MLYSIIKTADREKVHFFQDEKDIITNLDLYKDYTHFKSEINSWMTNEMKAETHLLTLNNYQKRINDFKVYLERFDYGKFMSEQ